MTPPVTELDQLKQQNALLLKRLLTVSRERDALARQLSARQPETGPANDAEAVMGGRQR